jgi:hypothetical protein
MPDARKRPQPPATTTIASPEIDVQSGANGVGNGPGYSGHEYDANDFAIDRALAKSAAGKPAPVADDDGTLPPENGRRAFFDQKTGAVRGSGVGAGGGCAGEDFASDPAAGDGFPVTGRTEVKR